jgi:hypothetical protein
MPPNNGYAQRTKIGVAMEVDEPEKPPIDHVAMTFERTEKGWKATAQTKVDELSARGPRIAEPRPP